MPERLVNNVILILLSRFAMILATAALPVAGWMIQRGVASVDRLGDKVDALKEQLTDTTVTIRIIQQSQQVQNSVITDHEMRMRILERRQN